MLVSRLEGTCSSLLQPRPPRRGAAEHRESPTPYWRILSRGCGLRTPRDRYGEFFCGSRRAARNLESPRSLRVYFQAPGTLRLNWIGREQVRSAERKGGPRAQGSGAGRRAGPALEAPLRDGNQGWGCVAARLCTLLAGCPKEQKYWGSLERFQSS